MVLGHRRHSAASKFRAWFILQISCRDMWLTLFLHTGSRASQDDSRDMHLTDDETVVDAEQGSGAYDHVEMSI